MASELEELLSGDAKAAERDSLRAQVEEWIKRSNGSASGLLRVIIDDCGESGDHLLLIRMQCSPEGHKEPELYAAHAGIADLMMMTTEATRQIVRALTGDSAISMSAMSMGEDGHEEEGEEDGTE
jgi:hypothetical protein